MFILKQIRIDLRRILMVLIALCLCAALLVTALNAIVMLSAKRHFVSFEEAAENQYDCILVLGCGVRGGRPTMMLRDRLQMGISLYESGASGKILMSGDHGQESYDEVNVMKEYAMDAGIPSCDIFMDHAGFSTYESMYRARDVFCADRILIVTQGYHLYRAVFVARALGLDAEGIAVESSVRYGQVYREVREIAARCKDCFTALFKPEPTFLGDAIPVSGDGNLTND